MSEGTVGGAAATAAATVAAAAGRASEGAPEAEVGLSGPTLARLVPWLQWPELRRTCLAQKACSREVARAIHQRYLTQAPTGIRARLERLGRRLNGAQAAQARGSPEAMATVSSDLLVLRQSAFVLAENCSNYADLFEHIGFVVGDELDELATAVLDAIERVQSFQEAVERLREAVAASQAQPRISCRAHPDEEEWYR